MNAQVIRDTKSLQNQIANQFAEARKTVKPYKFIGFQEANTAVQNAKKLLGGR